MKKETIFRHEMNESIQADAAMSCLKNRNNHKQLNETSDFDARFEFRKDLRELASPVAKKAYMIIRRQYGDGMWRQLYMDDCDERGLIDMLNMYAEDGLNPQQIVNKMLGVREDQETVDYAQLTDDVCASYRGTLSKLDLKDSINYIVKMVAKKIGKTVDELTPQELTAIQKAAKHSVWYVSEQEESADEKGAFALKLVKKFKNRMTPDYAKRPEMFMMLKLQKALKKPLMSLSKEEYRAWAKAICDACESVFGSTQEQEEDGINKGGMHNLVQVGHIMNTPSLLDKLDTEYFSDLEQQEAYYDNFRAIAELVADQIDRENGKDIDNNMDTLFEIVQEVWNNNPDDLYIWDFDDVQEKDCYEFFDKYYETIKNEYLKREHNNIMDALHGDLFASEQEELPQMERHDIILALSEYMAESWIDTGDDGDLDDIYYAVADVLDNTGDYPQSTDWEDCKPWCQKYYKEVEAKIY